MIIADDHQLFRSGMSLLVESFKAVGNVRQASNGKEVINLIKEKKPHVVLMDIEMPVMNGLEASEYIIRHFDEVKIIAVTSHKSDTFIIHMLEAGVHGYLLKEADPEEVEKAIESVVERDFFHNDLIISVMRKGLMKKADRPSILSKKELTEREVQVIKLICKEKTNQEIGEELFISPRTVEKIRASAINKLGVKGTVGLVKYAIEYGYDL